MVRFLADINFNGHVLNGVLARNPTIDLLRAQDAGLDGVDDPDVLAWAAQERRLLITHDVSTMSYYARLRLANGEHLAGVVIVPNHLPVRTMIDNILLIDFCSEQDEWIDTIVHMTP